MTFKPIQAELDQVRSCMTDLILCGDPLLDSCFQELSQRQGKMLRPALVLLCGKMIGSVQPLHVRFAAVVELIHTASLLHDDVIDQAQMRRNRPAANVLWGNTAAILLGDFLLSRAFSLLAQETQPEAVSLLCRTAETLCKGELKQNLFRGRLDLTQQQYFDIIETKTAALFSCSCRLGAMASNGRPSEIEAVTAYGRHLGTAFQIMDDLADIRSSSQKAGKTLGTDFLHEKLTLPVIHWINQNPLERDQRVKVLSGLSADDLFVLLRDSGSIDYASSLANEHCTLAKSELAVFKSSDSHDVLCEMAAQIADSPR